MYTLYCITKRKKFQVKINYFIFFIENNGNLSVKTGFFRKFWNNCFSFYKIELTYYQICTIINYIIKGNGKKYMNFTIREATPADYEGIKEIYAQGIESGTATFRTKTPEYEEWDRSHHPFCRYIAESEGIIAGWTSLTFGLTRGAYKGVAELSIYVRDGYRRHGIGYALIEEVKKNASEYGIWTLESRVCRQNTGSIRLHEKCGFRTVGIRERIARDKFGVWQDTVEMEYRL